MITIITEEPGKLLTKIRDAVDDKAIETWEYDDEGDFTHTPPQWRRKAWLRPSVEQNKLSFYIVPHTQGLSVPVYAVYHGRFIEMMLTHFDKSFSLAFASAALSGGDIIPS